MEDSILTVIITILVTLIAIISQVRKKVPPSSNENPQRDVLAEPFPTDTFDNPEEVIRRFFGEIPEEKPMPPSVETENKPVFQEGEDNPEPFYEPYTGEDLQEPEEIRREKEKLLSEEGIPATIAYSSQAEKEAFADTSVSISSAEISGTKPYEEDIQSMHPLLQDIDWRKAVIYSEILRRKDQF